MDRKELKQIVFEQNLALPRLGLVLYTWGNVSMINRESGEIAIKPSGVSYEQMRPEDIVVVDINGQVIEGTLRPSSDLDTHLVLYRAFESVGGVVHTHSTFATSWAQAARGIPCFGTTHADYFYGEVPVTRAMKKEEVQTAYEERTGDVIVETFRKRDIDPAQMPGVLVHSHGPFTWGKDAAQAVHNAAVLEEVARMAMNTVLISPPTAQAYNISRSLLDKHFLRKHGKDAYYGQK